MLKPHHLALHPTGNAMVRLLLITFISISASSLAETPAESPLYYLQWEAEDTRESNFPARGAFDPTTPAEAALLSNGRWLNVSEKSAQYRAAYTIDLAESAHYQFYTRKFWFHGDFRYRFNDDDWIEIRRENHPILLDNTTIKPPYVGANWVHLGEHYLAAGEHRFELQLLSIRGAAAFDSFILSNQIISPLGLRPPGTKLNLRENNRWSFEPDIDFFTDDSLWDLRSLNEPIAGMNGYVKRDESGNNFLLADGKPVRFWAMNTTIHKSPNIKQIEYHARHLAKRGFNMVRFHGHIESKTADLFAADHSQIEESWRLVAAMKKQGIYTTLSPYWGISAKAHPEWQGLEGHKNGKLAGLLFFDNTLQEAYKAWLKQWLTTPNPYTGIPLAKDPAVALFQIQNEDSLLFWTFNSIKGKHLEQLEQRYTQWLLERYQSIDAIKNRWGSLNAERDSQAPHLSLLPIWELTQDRNGKRKQRLDDQYTFLLDVMQSWNQDVETYLRDEIGYQGLINAGNWRTANNQKMLDGERLSYAANQVMATNRYYSSGKHINPNRQHRASYAVDNGDWFEAKSILFHPHKLPINIKQVDGYPTIVSEATWSNPNPYRSEAPFLIAAYSSLNGIDGFYWFSTGSTLGFDNRFTKFPAASPDLMASYPAAALLYRKGYVKTATPSIREYRSLEDIIARELPTVSEDAGFDPNRDSLFARFIETKTDIEKNQVFLQGPVISHYKQSGKTQFNSQETSTQQQHIKSNTGELEWDYGKGIATLNSPKAQGATGFLNQQPSIVLDQLSIASETDYASVLLVALDDKNITESENLLLQITTQSRPHGYTVVPKVFTDIYNKKDEKTYEGFEIQALGNMPYMIDNHQIRIAIKNNNIRSITATDINGYAVSEVSFTRTNDGIEFTPPEDTIYLVLLRR